MSRRINPPTPFRIGPARRRGGSAAFVSLLLVVAACGDTEESDDGAADDAAADDAAADGPSGATAIPDEPGGAAPIGVEPGTGTEVALAPPDTAPVGETIAIPMTVSVGSGEVTWTDARVDVVAQPPLDARSEIDLAGLTDGGSVTGQLVLDVEPGTAEEPSRGSVKVTLELLAGSEPATARVAQLSVLADAATVYLGFGSVGDLERAWLLDLLESGEISQREYDRAHAATLEKITGSVEVKDG